MKIRFTPQIDGPEYYDLDNNDIITAYKDNISENYDLSSLEYGGELLGIKSDVIDVHQKYESEDGKIETVDFTRYFVIRDAHRDELNELYVTLCQVVKPDHWGASDWIDSSEYDPNKVYVDYRGSNYSTAWVLTKNGKVSPEQQ